MSLSRIETILARVSKVFITIIIISNHFSVPDQLLDTLHKCCELSSMSFGFLNQSLRLELAGVIGDYI